MVSNELVIDSFERIKSVVHQAAKGLSIDELAYRPTPTANSIAWLIWHLSRIQDDHIAELTGEKQVWAAGWFDKFELPFKEGATGYGQISDEVAAVQVSADLLLGYHDAVHKNTIDYVSKLKDKDYKKVVDERWTPPVTLAVRLISVIADDLQHAGQAAYIRGLL
jgi:uncharacterized damage-inducible protein DinB